MAMTGGCDAGVVAAADTSFQVARGLRQAAERFPLQSAKAMALCCVLSGIAGVTIPVAMRHMGAYLAMASGIFLGAIRDITSTRVCSVREAEGGNEARTTTKPRIQTTRIRAWVRAPQWSG